MKMSVKMKYLNEICVNILCEMSKLKAVKKLKIKLTQLKMKWRENEKKK
jgi:hypothetical protein